MSKTIVVAIGGNALTGASDSGTYAEQAANAAGMAAAVRRLIATGRSVVLVHGNGPQVGNLLIQQESGEGQVPSQPLFVLDSMTQGQIGTTLALALHAEIGTWGPPVVSVVTHVLVDPSDPAFSQPTKPVGPFFSAAEAAQLGPQRGWTLTEDSGRGWRRVVPSPEPLEIVEIDVIRQLSDSGTLVIAAGGGGVPVIRGDGLSGVDAVIDKDRSAALLAASLGAEALVLITGVPHVMLDFGSPDARPVHNMTVSEAQKHLADGQFPPGSMGPKVEAAIGFLRRGGTTSLITSAGLAFDALAEDSANGVRPGTRIVSA